MKTTSIAFLFALLLAAVRLAAQPAGSLDTNFVAVAGTDVAPVRFAPLPDGRLYVGGQFTNYGGAGKAAVARLQADGQVDAAFTLPPLRQISAAVIFNGQVLVPASTNAGQLDAILALPDGRLVVAGKFTHVGATPAKNLIVVGADGTPAVTSFPIGDLEPQPFALIAGPAGTFYVGNRGNLTSGRLPLLRLKTDGSLDAAFTPPTLAELGYQSANPFILLRGPGDTLYAVTAAAVNSAPASDILRLTSSGALDTSFAGTGKANIPFANLSSFVTDPAGRLTFAGVTSYRGTPLARKLNRLNLDGSLDLTFQPTVNPGIGGRVVGAQADGKILYNGGQLAIYRLNADGTPDTGYADPGTVPVKQSFLSLTAFAMAPDGSVFAGGFTFSPSFQLRNGAYHIFGDPNSAPTIAVQPVAQTNTFGARTRFFVTAQGTAPLTYQWFRNGAAIGGATGISLVLEPTTAADSDAEFHCVVANAQGSTPSAKARLTLLAAPPGSVYRESDAPVGADSTVMDLRWDAAGRLVAAGGFTKFHGTNRIRVARLLDEGRLVDPAFEPTGINNAGLLQVVLPLRSGKLLATGSVVLDYGGSQHTGTLRLTETGALDTTFNVAGAGGNGSERFSEMADGRLFIASQIWNGASHPSGFGRLSAAGVHETAFVPSPAFRAGRTSLVLPDGKVLVAGSADALLQVNGSGVLRLNADGTQDPTFYRGQFANWQRPSVNALLRQADGKILVAGSFYETSNGPERIIGVIRLLTDGQLDPTFNPVPALSAINFGPVLDLALQADGRILIHGGFNNVGGYPRAGVARLWPNGVVDPEFSSGLPKRGLTDGWVEAVAVSPANNVFLGGEFQQFDGLPRTNFVRLNGGPLQPVPAPPTIASVPARVVAATGTNLTLTVVPAGDGPFQYQWRRNVRTGSPQFSDLAGETNASLTLPNIRVEDSGLFQVAVVNPGGAVFSAYLTLLVEPDPVVPGTLDRSWAAQNILRGVVAAAPGGLVYGAGGTGVTRHLEDGTPDLSFVSPADLVRPDNFVDNGITALLRQPDGKLIVTGRLSTEGGPCNVPGNTCFLPKRGLVRLLPDGSYDPGFIQTNSYSGDAQIKPGLLLLQPDGKIVVGGGFQDFSGRTVAGMARFSATGEFDDSFSVKLESALTNPLRTQPGTATVLLPLPDGRFYVGGGFTRAQGVARSGIVRLNSDGSLDSSFVPPVMANVGLGETGSLTLYSVGPVTPAGGVYVFGRFQLVANGPVYAALRLRADGSVDDTFRVITDFAINTGVVQADGKLIITGQFGLLNGQPRAGYARLNLDGSTDTSFTPGASFGVGVPLTILSDGKLLAGGARYFTGVGVEVAAPELAFTATPARLELTWPAGSHLQRTTTLAPPHWVDVDAKSPFTVPLGEAGEFYRVVPLRP